MLKLGILFRPIKSPTIPLIMEQRSHTNVFKSACAMATVATCWGVGQQASGQTLEIQSEAFASYTGDATIPISSFYLLYGNGNSGFINFSDIFLAPLPDAMDGMMLKNVTLQTIPNEFQYTLIGLYSDSANPDPNERFGVSVTLDSDFLAGRVGSEFGDVFSGTSEADLIAALAGEDTTAIKTFFQDNYGSGLFVNTYGESGTQLNFSTGNIVGSALLSPVPEPGASVLLGVSALLVSFRRRRFS